MTTHRERREARAARLRDWAESREQAADAAHASVHQIADGIPFGQPILVGHHSEKRARKDQARMDAGMRASIDNSKMADRHSSRADNIEAQLANSIYSDDPDAIEALEAKVARLEAQQEERKAANAAYRAEHKAELKTMTPYQRSEAVPYPPYSISNLGATIRTAKKRIEDLQRAAAIIASGSRGRGRDMESRFPGTCPECGDAIEKGSPITYYRLTREALHAACAKGETPANTV